MTGFRVQFLDDTAPSAGEPAPTVRPGWRQIAPLSLIAPALWLSAAALCVVAGTRVLWTYSFNATIESHGGYDAWGRALDHSDAGDQGPRYAVVLWLCAVLFFVLAGAVLRGGAPRGARWLHRHATAVGIGVTALLAGVLASIGLSLQSSFETYRALADSLSAGHGGVQLRIGGCLWCGVAALMIAVAAGLVHARVNSSNHLAADSV